MRQRAAGMQQGEGADEEVMLDSAEQHAVVAELAAASMRHSRTWRAAFGTLGAVLGLAFLWFAARQAAEPWTGYRHHAAFQGVLPAGVVVIVEALSGACLLAPALLLLRGMPSPNLSVAAGDSRDPLIGLPAKYCDSSDHHQVEEQQLRRCIAASSFMAALWLLSILVAGRGSSLARLAWLPVLPLAFAGLALSVVRGQADSAAALLALQAQMYNHEKA